MNSTTPHATASLPRSSAADALLSELDALAGVSSEVLSFSWDEAINEISAILDAYKGELPTTAARNRFYRIDQKENASKTVVFKRFFEIAYPVPYAKQVGYTNM